MSRIRAALAWRPPIVDVAIGVGISALTLIAGASEIGPKGPVGPLDAGAVVLAFALAVVLSLRRRIPFTVLLAVDAIIVGWYLLEYHGRLITVGALIACYTVATIRGWRWGLAGWVATGVVSTIVVHGTLGVAWFDDRAVNALSIEVAAVALGAAVHYHRAFAAGARERAEEIAEARAEQARLRSAEQRLEIARDLHDVVGHTLATISVQAGVAVHVMSRHPAQAASALTTIKMISDEGLAEVQVLLGVLRVDDGTPASGGLAHLDTLLEVTRATGLPVELTVRGDRTPLPPQVDLAAFRIVQESLTNVRRHARAASVDVRLAYGDDVLEILVRNDGVSAVTGGSTPAGGNGITGMRARVVALGGTMTAERVDDRFEVRCTLPTSPRNP